MADAVAQPDKRGESPQSKKNEWPIFVSYRRDALTREIAIWLKEELERETIEANTGQRFTLDVFVDVAAGHQSDFQANLVPYLEHSRALIVLVDTGALVRKNEGSVDYLYSELDWWAAHRRKTPPILLQLDTQSAAKLVADARYSAWRKVSFIDCAWEDWKKRPDGGRVEQDRLLKLLRESTRDYGQIIHLEEVRRLRQRATVAILFAVVALIAAALAWWQKWEADTQRDIAKKRQEAAETSKRLALQKLENANESIETLTGFAESAGGGTRTERELLIEAAKAYNQLLSGDYSDDPAFQFEKAWALDRLSQVEQSLEDFGFRPTGAGAAEGIFDSAKDAENTARSILDNLLKIDPTSARYADERGHNSMLKAIRLVNDKDYSGAVEAIDSAIKDFDSAILAEPKFTLWRLNRAEAGDRLVDLLDVLPERLLDAELAIKQTNEAFEQLIKVAGDPADNLTAIDYRRLFAAFEAKQALRELKEKPDQAIALLRKASTHAYTCATQYRADSRYERAFLALQIAEEAAKRVSEMNPINADDGSDYATALNLQGDLLLSVGRDDQTQIDEAFKAFNAAKEIYEKSCNADQANGKARDKHLYAGVLNNLADIAQRQQRLSEALALLDKALEIQLALVMEDPANLGYREFRRNHRQERVITLIKLNRKDEAMEELKRLAADARGDLDVLEREPQKPGKEVKKALAATFARMSELAPYFGMPDVEIDACAKAVVLLEEIARVSRDQVENFNFVIGYRRLASMELKRGDAKGAVENNQKA
jgi:tetratricopeptide (TPR) repeat protein